MWNFPLPLFPVYISVPLRSAPCPSLLQTEPLTPYSPASPAPHPPLPTPYSNPLRTAISHSASSHSGSASRATESHPPTMRQRAARSCLWRHYARPPRSWKSWMRLRRRWHGMSCLLSSSTPVVGEVLWVLSHCSMALRSYVWPSTCQAPGRGDECKSER